MNTIFFSSFIPLCARRDACKQNNSQLLSLLFTFFVPKRTIGGKEEGEKGKK